MSLGDAEFKAAGWTPHPTGNAYTFQKGPLVAVAKRVTAHPDGDLWNLEWWENGGRGLPFGESGRHRELIAVIQQRARRVK